MTGDLIAFLTVRLNEAHAALLAYRDGHTGPCLNFEGQRPEDYDEYDSCYLHLQAAKATPYSDAAFGLAEVDVKRKLIAEHARQEREDGCVVCDAGNESCGCMSGSHWSYPCDTIKILALPFANHPDYREEWRP